MLTNNKKGLFVKGISMMLAVLMVLAVALTGCTDSDAQKKIDELQTVVDNKANKADVTTEVSAAIANALKDYLKTNDAVTEAAVKELINSSVADFAKKSDLNNLATKEALKGYVTSDELKKLVTTDALTNALKGYVKSSDLNGLVTNEALKLYVKSEEFNALKESLKSYVTSDDVTKAIEAYVATEAFKQAVKNIAGNSLSRADIEQIVKNVLAEGKYTNKDDVQNAIDATLKNYFGELDAETVLKILTEQKKQMDAKDSPMTEKEWNSATELVIATINSIQTTFSKIRSNIYTAANKAAINAAVKPLGITVFNANGSFANTAAYETKLIEYRILRVADVKEIQALKTAVEAAGAVETFNDEWAKIEKALYALGENVTVKKSNRKDDDTNQKYGANDKTYHGVSVSNGQVKLTQVVTYADKAAFQALCEQIDKLIVKYGSENLLDLAGMNTPFAASNIRGGTSGLRDVYKKVEKAHTNNVTYVIVPAGTYKSSPYANKDLTGITPTDPADASTYTYTYVTTTAFFNGTAASMAYGQQDPTRLYSLDMSALGTVTLGTQYTAKYAGTQYAADGTITYTALDSDVGATITSAANADSYKEWLGAYTAVVAMLTDCNDYVNKANTVFKNFVTDAMGAKMAVAPDKRGALWTTTSNNQTLVDALDASLSEPNGTNSYHYYLTNGTSKLATVDGTGLVDYRKIVSAGVDAALLINGGSQAGLARYDLYLELIAKSNAALFPKYQALALRVLDRMYNDFNSVVLASKTVVGNAGNDLDFSGVNRTELNTTNFTPEFLAAYLNGTGTISYQIGPKNIKFSGLKGLYANNRMANVLSDVNTQTAVMSDVLSTLKANNLTLSIELKASTVGVRAAINSKSAKDVADGSVKAMNAFDELLNQALANLNEVMYRYQVEDIKKAVLNEMTAYAADRAVYYSTIDTAKVAPLTTALQQYLTGASAGASAGDPGLPGFTFNTTTVNGSTVTTVASKESNVFAGINNRAFYDQLTAITVNMNDSIDGIVIGTTGTQAYNAVMAAKAAVKATMENMSVKYNFNDYLDDASTNARMAMYSYTQLPAATWTYENILAFQAAYNETLGVLTIEQYNHNRNGIALEEYKTRYISKVLSAIVENDDAHSVLVNGKATPADAFAEMLKAVKSSATSIAPAGATNVVYNPVRPLNFVAGAVAGTSAASGTVPYQYAGSLVVALDRIANANTVCTYTKDGKQGSVKLY